MPPISWEALFIQPGCRTEGEISSKVSHETHLIVEKLIYDGAHLLPVIEDSSVSFVCKTDDGPGNLIHEFLLYADESCLFECVQVRGKVSSGKSDLVHEKDEIYAVNRGQVSQDHQTGR